MTDIHKEFLFVDDNTELLYALKSYFSKEDLDGPMYFLQTPNEVLTHLCLTKAKNIIMVLDYNLGGKDGLELVGEIRSKYDKTKNIMISIYSNILPMKTVKKLKLAFRVDWYIDKNRDDSLEQLRNFVKQFSS
jgi:CheY-like chemotaxis protein